MQITRTAHLNLLVWSQIYPNALPLFPALACSILRAAHSCWASQAGLAESDKSTDGKLGGEARHGFVPLCHLHTPAEQVCQGSGFRLATASGLQLIPFSVLIPLSSVLAYCPSCLTPLSPFKPSHAFILTLRLENVLYRPV